MNKQLQPGDLCAVFCKTPRQRKWRKTECMVLITRVDKAGLSWRTTTAWCHRFDSPMLTHSDSTARYTDNRKLVPLVRLTAPQREALLKNTYTLDWREIAI